MKSDSLANLQGFEFFWFCLAVPDPEKLKNVIFENPVIPQTLDINN